MSDFANFAVKLGQKTGEQDVSLDAVPRELSRGKIQLPKGMKGRDLWNAYEASFLLPNGKPENMILRLTFDAYSEKVVESKSMKLFLNHLSNQVFSGSAAYMAAVSEAVTACLGVSPVLQDFQAEKFTPARKLAGMYLDQLESRMIPTHPDAGHLRVKNSSGLWRFHSYSFRSLCPVTGQPDWGAISIDFLGGKTLEAESLFEYLVSFRNHRDFHEACCDRIFADLHQVLSPDWLHVTCNYNRRGGIDINPTRVIGTGLPVFHPVWRQ